MAKRLKFRTPRSYARRAPSREPYDSVALVCEGRKTEPYYFQGLRAHYRLSNANIVIVPEGGDPLAIVRRAIEELRDSALDRAYCVFDQDSHGTYDEALRAIAGHEFGRSGRLFAANSVPCFELWLLLHFIYSAAPYMSAGGRSAGARVLEDLQRHWPEYSKGRPDTFEVLLPRLDAASQNARRLAAHNSATGSSNPATEIYGLVRYLKDLKK